MSRAGALADLTREGARRAAREELSRREYQEAQPPLLVRALRRAFELLGEMLHAVPAVPGGRAGVLLLVLLLLGVVAVVASRLGPLQRGGRRAPGLDEGVRRTAAGHREAAEQAARQGRWDEAVRERLRAVVRELEGRGVLDPRAGRTAAEVAGDAGAALPALAGELRRAAALFDEVWYGGRTADAAAYAVLVAVDEQVAQARVTG